ncbi:hypothetical protein [Neobacillus kokaensis]|uniref:Uncharacterized protein n=1 Tax=Neobacillus kokaensis TaxID=2759023 RepID=A0ABQ3NC15_9BACI|nr:hypothetical protein [Neobacillus kokaensis]GHI01477.1 hypothetical protein AM1BK_50190 [Neobacillus kokaensis]
MVNYSMKISISPEVSEKNEHLIFDLQLLQRENSTRLSPEPAPTAAGLVPLSSHPRK